MSNKSRLVNIARPTYGWFWFVGPLGLLVLYVILGLFDTQSELAPSHETVLQCCFVLGGLGGLFLASMVIFGR